jgi:hypothetical protein
MKFEEYIKQNKIIIVYLSAHSSYIIQPLDIDCYNVLKKYYDIEINLFIKTKIIYIIKSEFFLAFKSAFYKTFIKENILGGFRRSGLISFNLQTVLSKLDVKLRTPTPPGTTDELSSPWVAVTIVIGAVLGTAIYCNNLRKPAPKARLASTILLSCIRKA